MRFLRVSAVVGAFALLAVPFAIRLQGQVLPVTGGVIVDDANVSGAFLPGTFKKHLQKIGYGGTTHAVFTPTYNVVKVGNVTTATMTSVASFSFANVQPGTYSVYATWPRKGDESVLVDIRVPAVGNNYLAYSNIRLNQSMLPSSMTTAGAAWQWVHRVKVDRAGTVVVRVFPNGKPRNVTYADAVMLVREGGVSSSSTTSAASSVVFTSSSQSSASSISPPLCNDGIDNDADGKIDYPQDPGCTSLQDDDEEGSSSNITLGSVVANGCNVTVSYAKNFPTCAHLITASTNSATHTQNLFCTNSGPITIPMSSLNSMFQVNTQVKLCNGNNYSDCSAPVTITGTTQCTPPQCQDGIDNDSDGVMDYPGDVSCTSATDDDETNQKAACQDGIDNDSDGTVDYPQDPGCASVQDNEEFNASSVDDIVLDNSAMRFDYRCTSVADTASVGGSYARCSVGAVATWNTLLVPGRYEIYATWKPSEDSSVRAAVDLRSTATFSSVEYINFTRPVSLQEAPSGTVIGGIPYRKVGSVDLLGTATMLTWADPDRILVGNAGKPIVIDALVLRRIGDTPYSSEPVDQVVLDDEYSVLARPHGASFPVGGYRGGYTLLHPELTPAVGTAAMTEFTVPPLRAGMYDVLATWPTIEGAARNALVVIRSSKYDGGNVFLVDQTIPTVGESFDGASWRVVGKAYFPSDGSARILVTPHALRGAYMQGAVIVDGFMLRRSADQAPSSTFVIDNEDPSFVTASTNYFVAPRTTDASAYRGTRVVLRNDTPGTVPDPVARGTVNDGGRTLAPGAYDVYATWAPQLSTTAVRFQVFADNTPMTDPDMEALTVDQRTPPVGLQWEGVTWQKIGTRTIRPGARTLYGNWYTGMTVDFTRASSRIIDADAIMLRPAEGSSSVSSATSSATSSVPTISPIRLHFVSVGCSGPIKTVTVSYQRHWDSGGCAALYDAAGVALDNGTMFCAYGGGMQRGMSSFLKPIVVGSRVRLCDTADTSVCSPAVIVTGVANACPGA